MEEEGKRVVISGVSKGLGRALALEMAKRGHTVIGCSRDNNKLDSLRLQLLNASSPQNHFLFKLDVRSNEDVKKMANAVRDQYGSVDIIVNSAGVINEKLKMWEIPVEMFDDTIDINIKGTANMLRHFIPLMLPTNQGIIVNISSIFGRTGAPGASPYCSSHWAIEGLSKTIAKELPNGITTVALDPGAINTDMCFFYLGDIASQYQSPEEWALKAAPMILNLTSADSGASLVVDDPGVLPPE